MRESNFAFPAQNRACVCISSQLYDRRALDTNSPLPLFNSLTHLTYLTSTSPRIREIMTMDGGLERLVRILHDFCICPPPPENPTLFYGLSPPSSHPLKLTPTLNPKQFDKQAQYRFSLAFQCVVNIGVRGSEPIRSRVVQAGTLDVVGCILEAWLAGRGFAVGPSVGANGMPRETREQRLARRQAQSEARQREQADALARALQRQLRPDRSVGEADAQTEEVQEDDHMDTEPTTAESTDNSSNATPGGTDTPTGAVVVPGRDRSGTVIARATWESAGPNTNHRRGHRSRHRAPSTSADASASTSADNSRPETETEDDGDVDMDRESSREDALSVSGTPPPERRGSIASTGTIRPNLHSRRAVGIVSDAAANAPGGSLDINSDAHIIINNQEAGVEGVTMEDGLVSLETNDDFAMGAPPGAPGAIDGPPARVPPDVHGPGERTPRAGMTNLPHPIPISVPPPPTTGIRVASTGEAGGTRTARTVTRGPNTLAGGSGTTAHVHHRDSELSGPYRDEDVLLSLQLLAYLSKYPHLRQAFYKPRATFHPATAQLAADGRVSQLSGTKDAAADMAGRVRVHPLPSATPPKESNSFLKVFTSATGRGKEKEKEKVSDVGTGDVNTAVAPGSSSNPPRMTNVFTLVERFTFRHSSADLDSSTPPPSLPPEIQYWAGVIMRNACRKDDSRGGIRQCANMMCGRWESFPREFAKCRRCRKAKYCGKECQSTAWSEGHRFWCSAKDNDEDGEHHHGHPGEGSSRSGDATTTLATRQAQHVASLHARAERRAERERSRQLAAERLVEQNGTARVPPNAMRSVVSNLSINPDATLAALNAPRLPPLGERDDAPVDEGIARTVIEDGTGDDMILG